MGHLSKYRVKDLTREKSIYVMFEYQVGIVLTVDPTYKVEGHRLKAPMHLG